MPGLGGNPITEPSQAIVAAAFATAGSVWLFIQLWRNASAQDAGMVFMCAVWTALAVAFWVKAVRMIRERRRRL